MERVNIEPRPNWELTAEAMDFSWHTPEGQPYWDESVYWHLTAEDVAELEAATVTLNEMAAMAVSDIINGQQLPLFGYDARTIKLIEHSWHNRAFQPSILTRIDLAYDGKGPPKLLEFNGDTPGTLFESAEFQRHWQQERYPEAQQFNNLESHLRNGLTKFRTFELGKLRPYGLPKLYTTSERFPEDEGTVAYLRRLCDELMIPSEHIHLEEIGWRENGGPGNPDCFVDMQDQPLELLFKFVPWEWLIDDPFGQHLMDEASRGNLTVLEPAWKMVITNKRFLAELWTMFPHHPNLLAASSDPRKITSARVVQKPFLGLAGENIRITEDGRTVEASDGYQVQDQYLYQEYTPLAEAEGNHAVIGSWLIDGRGAGIGIREDKALITGKTCRFVPHLVEG